MKKDFKIIENNYRLNFKRKISEDMFKQFKPWKYILEGMSSQIFLL